MNQLMRKTTVTNEAQYSTGTGGGSALKYEVKLPNLLTVRFAVDHLVLYQKCQEMESMVNQKLKMHLL